MKANFKSKKPNVSHSKIGALLFFSFELGNIALLRIFLCFPNVDLLIRIHFVDKIDFLWWEKFLGSQLKNSHRL